MGGNSLALIKGLAIRLNDKGQTVARWWVVEKDGETFDFPFFKEQIKEGTVKLTLDKHL